MKIKQLAILVIWIALVVILAITIGICAISSYILFFEKTPQTATFLPALFFAASILTAVPFCYVIFQCSRILRLLNSPEPIDVEIIKTLTKIIKGFFVVLCAFVLLGVPVIFTVAQIDDAPGFGGLGLLITLAIMAFMAIAYLTRDYLYHLSIKHHK